MKTYYVYILTNKTHTTLYIGITSNLITRIWQHKSKQLSGFTKKYNVNKLIYFEEYDDVSYAIHREKRLKEWKREWKINIINKFNPDWKDLYFELAS
ncbi:MAG: GIY-YIG nuclease family protein [Gammaproteobacteria bacterium]